VGEAEATMVFYFPEAVEVQLPDKALELAVPEEERCDFCLHLLRIKNINVFLGVVPTDYMLVLADLGQGYSTLRSLSSLDTKFPFLNYFCISKIIIFETEFDSKFI
jgi:hypothetical protein